jgi:hypothetical protein
MKSITFVFLLLWISSQVVAQQEYSKKYLEVDYSEHSAEKQSYTFKNLRLYPIKAKGEFLKQAQFAGKYTPLKEGLEKKLVVITERENAVTNTENDVHPNPVRRNHHHTPQQIEQTNEVQIQQVGGGATVNTLFIENTSKDTVYIMAGEIVQGGKQDRVIAQDMVLPPHSGKIDLSVFCVEHGRWSYKESSQFEGYFGVATMNMRKVVDKKQDQQEVWNEVSRSNDQINVKSGTDAFTERAKSADFVKEMQEYTEFFKNKFQNQHDIIGVVITTGNRVVGCDMFASPDLFKSQFNSLLSSYIGEALTDGKPVEITQVVVEDYMNKLLEDETSQQKVIEEKGKVFQQGKNKLHLSTH